MCYWIQRVFSALTKCGHRGGETATISAGASATHVTCGRPLIRVSNNRRRFDLLRLTATTTLLGGTVGLHQSTTSAAAVVAAGFPVELDGEYTRPHVLDTQLADTLVRVRGHHICSGTPLTGTNFVVTAAHCVLDTDGAVAGSTKVLRNGVEYTPVSVLVNTDYHNSPSPLLDAAVLVMDQIIPGSSATLAEEFPTEGLVTLAGFQPLDTDRSLLRGTRYDNRPPPSGATGGVIRIDTAVAGCVHLASEAEISDDHVSLPCGLIPGASGGGLFVEHNGEMIIAGIISTVAYDLRYNGLVPLAALHQLLENPGPFTYSMTIEASTPSAVNVIRS